MHQGYITIFWGIFFSTFHINIGMLQILPAFVGWLIVANGIQSLSNKSPSDSFHKAHNFALIMVVVCIIGPLSTWMEADYLIFDFMPVILSIFELPMIYYLLEGSMEHLQLKENGNTDIDFVGTRKTYMIIFLINTILTCFAITIASPGMMMVVAMIGIFLILWLMQIVHTLKKLQDP
jgi:hypothetical protein